MVLILVADCDRVENAGLDYERVLRHAAYVFRSPESVSFARWRRHE